MFIVCKAPQGQGIWRTCGWFPCGGLKWGSLCDESYCLEMLPLSTERRVIWGWSSDLLTLVFSLSTFTGGGCDLCWSTLNVVFTLGSILFYFIYLFILQCHYYIIWDLLGQIWCNLVFLFYFIVSLLCRTYFIIFSFFLFLSLLEHIICFF